MLAYDESALVGALQALPAWARTAFAAACATRLAPVFRRFALGVPLANASELDLVIDALWRLLEMGAQTDCGLEADLDHLMEMIPDQEDSDTWTPLHAYAEDATSAVAYCLRAAMTGEPQEAAWAARCVYGALHFYVVHSTGIDRRVDEQQVPSHSVIQLELMRQQRDLAELLGSPLAPDKHTIQRLSERARAEQALPTG